MTKEYGQMYIDRIRFITHRFSYEYYHGDLDSSKVIHHKCNNRKCVNPIHLEQISNKENVLMGVGPTAINARKTHCNHGHEFTPENTFSNNITGRGCKQCRARRLREFRARSKHKQ